MIVQKEIDTFTMNLDLSDNGISNALYHNGIRERAFMSILRNSIDNGDVCVDLGANIGYTTLFMAKKVGQDGHVYAIEPDAHNLELLTSNIETNNFTEITTIDQCAISDSNGTIDFWIARHPNLNSVKKTKHSIRKEEVPCFTLEKYLENKRYPNFIKMDVEGHEVKIFEGGLDYFSKNEGKTNFLVEVHPHFYDEGNDFGKILSEYFKIGFSCKFAVSTPVPRPRKFIEAGYEPMMEIPTDGFLRGLYGKISNEHLIEFACKENIEGNSKKIVRSFMLGRD
tara:strand:- start:12057 stop:12902 length:846 start_codon:yes stop_codon:yes gene_type:complete